MKNFTAGLLLTVGVIFIPTYVCWLITCVLQGHWMTLNIFSWGPLLRCIVATWFTIVFVCIVVALIAVFNKDKL